MYDKFNYYSINAIIISMPSTESFPYLLLCWWYKILLKINLLIIKISFLYRIS